MDGSIMEGPILSASELDLDLVDPPLHHHSTGVVSHHLQGMAPLATTQQQQQQQQHHHHHHHLNVNSEPDQPLVFDSKHNPKASFKGKLLSSDEDERSFTEGDWLLNGYDGNSKNTSPWQRVKWTDSMVKLLILVVVLVGEDGANDPDNSKKKAGILLKKGKWRSVSRAMNERGCSVSPQQCEDKFNDLNKRYKRLNDILGKGIACCVVEDPSLLDSMDNLSAKAKNDVRRILSSKQLFYREICAYHNGCDRSVLMPAAEFDLTPSVQVSANSNQNQDLVDASRHRNEGAKVAHHDDNGDENDEGEDDEDEEHVDEDIDDGNDDGEDGYDEDDMANGMGSSSHTWTTSSPLERHKKSMKNLGGNPSPLFDCAQARVSECLDMEQLSGMPAGVKPILDASRSRIIELEEEKVKLLAEKLELHKQRFKWERINDKKNRELERQKLDNQKMKLENERLSLLLKRKELDVECKRSEASMNSMDMILERLHSKESMDYNQEQQPAMG